MPRKQPVSPACDDEECFGIFLVCNDGESFTVERCDTCQRFETDHDAGAALQTIVGRLGALKVMLGAV